MATYKKRMRITFNALGEGPLECVGYRTFRCLGKKGMSYPNDVWINPTRRGAKENPHYSNAYSCAPNNDSRGRCIMKYSILVVPAWGVFIHEWPGPATYAGNGGPSHGCIHLEHGDAELVYNWVDEPTHLIITYPWRRRP